MSYRRRFIKCYTNQVLHFDITMTSRDKDFSCRLKQQLSKFIDDLKTIMNDINLMLINELQNYRIALDDDRMHYLMKLRKPVFEQLVFFVITIALRKILSQYKLMIERFMLKDK
jgi:HJR/Mrr/RecB family endonuclease